MTTNLNEPVVNQPATRNDQQKAEELSLRSEEVKDILGKPPGWIVSWGTAVLFMVIVILFSGSWFFSYPDIVRAPAIITKENPASVLVARISGKPSAIFYNDGTTVQKNDTLAVIENPARYEDISRLGRFVRFINQSLISGQGMPLTSIPEDMVLGEIQSDFNLFISSWHDYRIFVNQDFYESKITALSDELRQYFSYRDNLDRQRSLSVRDKDLGIAQFNRDSVLFASGVISSSEYEKAQELLLSKLKAVETSELSLSEAGITIARLERTIADTRLEKDERQQRLMTNLINAFRQVESSLATWENKYLFIAPAPGTLNYLSVWSSMQEISAGDAVFSIVPEQMGNLHARIILPFRGAGKVRPGQRVNVKLDGYPYMEYGMVTGNIHSVSGGPVEGGFPAIISLDRGAMTTFGYELEVIRELPGTAEISTEEMSLLERLFSPLKHLLKNRVVNMPATRAAYNHSTPGN
jgi:hypothetical protein